MRRHGSRSRAGQSPGAAFGSPANGVCVVMVTKSLVLVFFFFLTLKVKLLILKCPQEIEILGRGLEFFV